MYDLRPGGKYSAHAPPEMRAMGLPDVLIDGEVLEAEAPRKLVQTYRFLFSDRSMRKRKPLTNTNPGKATAG